MTADIEDELRQAALERIVREFGAATIDPKARDEWVAGTPEGRAAAEIKQLRSRSALSHVPIPVPTDNTTSSSQPKYKSAIVACARWEADNILEWVAYHKSLGFEHIYLYCNDDDPAELYERLCPLIVGISPFVTFLYQPLIGVQTAMYKHFLRTAARDTEWLMFLDIDEFVVLKQHSDIQAFIREYERDCDAIYLNWAFFGNNGHVSRPSGNVLTQYIRRDRFVNPYTKMLTRVASLDLHRIVEDAETGFWHDWKDNLSGTVRRRNVLRDDMAGYYDDFPEGPRRYLDQDDRHARILQIAAIYHFAFRSEDDINRRIRRGVSGDFDGQLAFKNVVDRGELRSFLEVYNQVEDTYLKDYWHSLLERAVSTSIIPPAPGVNIALGKPADQSSRCEWSKGTTTQDDAAGAVSGVISGRGAFHTDHDDWPWWSVDLGETTPITEVRLYNRMDNTEVKGRASRFRIQLSGDGERWETAFAKTDGVAFGGVDGQPFIWRPGRPMDARFVRIQLLGRDFLHLDQVEVYGEHPESAGGDG